METDKNSIPEEIKSRSKSGNACYHWLQNLLSSSLLSNNIKKNNQDTENLILPVVLYGFETWFFTFMEERRPRCFFLVMHPVVFSCD